MLIEEKSDDFLAPGLNLKKALWENAAEPLLTKTFRRLNSFSKSTNQATLEKEMKSDSAEVKLIFLEYHLTLAHQGRVV